MQRIFSQLAFPILWFLGFGAGLFYSSAVFAFLGFAPNSQWLSRLQDGLAIGTWLSGAWTIHRFMVLALWYRVFADPSRIHAPRILIDLVAWVIYAVAIVSLAATWFNYEIASSAFATSGIVVAVIGFALRDTIADIFSGVTTHFERPYRIGDWLELQSGRIGEVVEINWRTTRLVSQDQLSHVIPNGLLSRVQYTNYSQPQRHFREAIKLRLSPTVSPERAKRVLMNALASLSGTLRDPPPEVRAVEVDRSGVTYEARFWVPDFPQLTSLRDTAITNLVEHLDKAGISLAADRREVTVSRAARQALRHLQPFELLRRIELFDVLDDRDAAILANALKERRMLAGQAVVNEGDAGNSLFILAEGVLIVEQAASEGVLPLRLAQIDPGGVFGEMSFLTGQARSATVRAQTDALLYEIDGLALEPILQRQEELAQLLSAKVARRIGRNEAAITERSDQNGNGLDESRLSSQILSRIKAFFHLKG